MLATDRRVAVIKALAHPTRLHIAETLAKGPQCVSELHSMVDADLSTVSKHLSLMRGAGWIACEKLGQQVYYSLACDCLETFLHCIDSLVGDNSDCC